MNIFKEYIKNMDIKRFFTNNIIFLFLILYLTFKNLISYYLEFKVGITTNFQFIIAFLSIFSVGFLLYGFSFLFKSRRSHYVYLLLINILFTSLLIGNIYYFREFSDFLSIDTILKSSASNQGMTGATIKMMKPYDIIYIIDTLCLIIFMVTTKLGKSIPYKRNIVLQPLGLLMCCFSLFLAETDRPELLSRSFDNRYLVKYLGLTGYTAKNYHDYTKLQNMRANASENDFSQAFAHTQTKKSKETNYYGVAKDKNVVYIHLESFQQFLIDYKLKDDKGKEYEVTPYLNSIFHSNDTLAFDNAFHQVGQGKTSDAENMIENSLYGTENGSAMVKFGTDNTFVSAPTILKEYGYTSQVFHGNTDTFWNRNNAYKSYGYGMFYSLDTFKSNEVYGYGLKDEVFFKESLEKYKEIEGLKYSKFIPVTHHFPYKNQELSWDFPKGTSKDETVNDYFVTANYMDKQIEIFMNGLKESGELDNTIFVFYGDHYGISNSRNKDLNDILQITDDWTGYNNAMLQRVPTMFYIPNSNVNPKKEINHTYMGQIDILPTLLNLLGIEDKDYMFVGQNVFGDNYDNIVSFRDGSFVTPKYTYYKGKTYYTETGDKIDLDLVQNIDISVEIENIKEYVSNELLVSDTILNQNLMQFKYNKQDTHNKSKFPY